MRLTGYSYSCLLARLPEPLASKVRGYGLSIPDERIYDDEDGELGREDKPHVTVKFGLHTTDPQEVISKLQGQPSFRVTLGPMSVFYNEDCIVLKIGVEGRGIHELNRYISDVFECTDTYPEYRPHCTVAYLKKDAADPYWFNDYLSDQFAGIGVQFNALEFSVPSGQKYKIPLTGGSPPVEIDTMNTNRLAREIVKVARDVLAVDQYQTVNDAVAVTGLDELEPGRTEIWYAKPSFSRETGGLGYRYMEKEGILPDPKNLKKTHVLLGTVRERNPEKIWRAMQGEFWSPHGEARSLIRGSGLHHTSMSVGDIVKVGSKVFLTDMMGFKEL